MKLDTKERVLLLVLAWWSAGNRSRTCAQEVQFQPEERLAVGDEYDQPTGTAHCNRTLRADVVALDQVIFYNRMMAFLPSGMMYALRRDVEPIAGATPGPGDVRLRSDKRPRPLVLRMGAGDCLTINLQNLLIVLGRLCPFFLSFGGIS